MAQPKHARYIKYNFTPLQFVPQYLSHLACLNFKYEFDLFSLSMS